jgi:flagellar protein FlaG
MKNIGTQSITMSEITRSSDVFFSPVGSVQRLDYSGTPGSSTPGPTGIAGTWTFKLYDNNNNNVWDPGETLEIDAYTTVSNSPSGTPVTFQFILPGGIWRSSQFTVG